MSTMLIVCRTLGWIALGWIDRWWNDRESGFWVWLSYFFSLFVMWFLDPVLLLYSSCWADPIQKPQTRSLQIRSEWNLAE